MTSMSPDLTARSGASSPLCRQVALGACLATCRAWQSPRPDWHRDRLASGDHQDTPLCSQTRMVQSTRVTRYLRLCQVAGSCPMQGNEPPLHRRCASWSSARPCPAAKGAYTITGNLVCLHYIVLTHECQWFRLSIAGQTRLTMAPRSGRGNRAPTTGREVRVGVALSWTF